MISSVYLTVWTVILFNVIIFVDQKRSVKVIHREIRIIKTVDDLRECKSRKRNHIFNKQSMSFTAWSTDNTLNGNFDFSSKKIICQLWLPQVHSIEDKENEEMRSEYSFLNFIRASKSFLALEVLSFIE